MTKKFHYTWFQLWQSHGACLKMDELNRKQKRTRQKRNCIDRKLLLNLLLLNELIPSDTHKLNNFRVIWKTKKNWVTKCKNLIHSLTVYNITFRVCVSRDLKSKKLWKHFRTRHLQWHLWYTQCRTKWIEKKCLHEKRARHRTTSVTKVKRNWNPKLFAINFNFPL